LLRFAQEKGVDLTVVGPEIPLTAGVADVFAAAGQVIFGPTRAAARLESSKAFAKDFFRKYHIPTAAYEVFTDAEAAQACACRLAASGPVVIKADGLAAGKGVVIAGNPEEAAAAIRQMMTEKQFGAAGERVVVEEFLTGEELSFFAISDGQNALPFMAAQDHKRIFDHDLGPNTGGMGAYTTSAICGEALRNQIMEEIIYPTLQGMKAEGNPFRGVLYAGLMLTPAGPKLLEYNVRFGDPETQVLMPMLQSDAYDLFLRAATGDLRGYEPQIHAGTCVAVVVASAGYPGSYTTGRLITGLDDVAADTAVFQAGTKMTERGLETNGGRVLAVVCQGPALGEAIHRVYGEVDKIRFEGRYFRTDIGRKALDKEGFRPWDGRPNL
jgi:phosphoribosylamine--glycine ligase